MNLGNDVRITSEGEGLLGVRYPYKYKFHLDPFVSTMHPDAMLQGGVGETCWLLPALESTIKAAADFFGIGRETLPEELRAYLPPPPQRRQPNLNVIGAYEFHTQPYEHQRGGLAELIEHPRWLLAWEMGTGKTKVAADRLRWGWQWQEFQDRFILVFAPRSVVPVWIDNLAQHADLPATPLLGSGDSKRKTLARLRERPGPHIVVTNYESARTIGYELKALRPLAVIADECQLIKNSTTATHRGVIAIAQWSKYRWALSGTPAPNSPLDIHGVLLFVDQTLLESTTKTSFEAKYAVRRKLSKDPSSQEIVVGYQNLDDLSARVAQRSSRLLKEQCLDLPPKTFTTRSIGIEGEQLRIYRDLQKQAVAVLRDQQRAGVLSIKNVLNESGRLLQVLGGFVPDDAGNVYALDPAAKLTLLDETLEEIGRQQVVIWSCFRQEIAALAKRLRAGGRRVVEFHGGTSDADRAAGVREFQRGGADYFLGTPAAGGTGLTLTAASHALYYSRNFSLPEWLQSQDRIHRLTQTKACTITSLLGTVGGKPSVDHKVAASLDRKRDLQDMLLGDGLEAFL